MDAVVSALPTETPYSKIMTQKNFEFEDLFLLSDHSTARGQYPLARVVEVFPNDKGIVWRVRILTANANRLNTYLRCTRATLDRDTTKLALLDFPAINPISKNFHVPESNSLIVESFETHTLTRHTYTLPPESTHSSLIPCKIDRKN